MVFLMLSNVFGPARRSFDTLSEQEILALAISSEEDDGRIYRAYADGLRPVSGLGKVFDSMADERHASRRTDRAAPRGSASFTDHAKHVRAISPSRTGWCGRGVEHVRAQAEMEAQASQFYTPRRSTTRTLDASCSATWRQRNSRTGRWRTAPGRACARRRAGAGARRNTQAVHLPMCSPAWPGDGRIGVDAGADFAAAFATGDTWQAFLVGLSASVAPASR